MNFKKLISNTLKYWYVYILSFCFLETINYGVLSLFVPERVCFWLSAFLILLFAGYMCMLVSAVFDRISLIIKEKEMKLNQTIDDLRKHVDELDNENKELSRELAKSLSDDISSGNDNVIRTIEADLTNCKDFIVTEVQDIGNELKEIIHKDSSSLMNKSNDIIENQEKCTEKIMNNEKNVVNECTDLLKERATAIIEQNDKLINKLSNELSKENKENVESLISRCDKISKETMDVLEKNHKENADKQAQHYKNIINAVEKAETKFVSELEDNSKAIKNVDLKIEEEFKAVNENNKLQNVEIIKKIDNNQSDLKQDIDSVKKEIVKEAEKTDRIVEAGNAIIVNVEKSIEENQRAFANICESQEKHADDIKASVSVSINEASEKEVNEIRGFKDIVITKVTENAKTQNLHAEALVIKLNEKIGEMIQSSNGELKKHLVEQIKELNTSYLEMKKTYETNNEKIEEKVIGLHSETTKLINLLLDNVEDNSEKNERYIDILGKQISEAAKQNKNSINALMNELEKNKEQAIKITEKLSEYTVEHKKNTGDSEKRIQEYIKSLSDYYSKCFDKIDNIQSEILSISHATNLLNNLYSKLQTSIKENAERDAHVIKEKPERIEEYKDADSGAIVKNHYKHNKLSYSEMIVAGKKSYDVQYDNEGKALKSRNYNKQGEIVSEIEFYKNGQVKTRKEILVKKGKKETVISKFDEKGNKIK